MQKFFNLFKWFSSFLLAGVVILIITIVVFLNKPSLFIDDIEEIASKFINQNLNSTFKINVSSIDGNFVSGFYAKNTNIYLNSELIASIDSVYINPNISDLFYFNISFSNISFINPEIHQLNLDQFELTNYDNNYFNINLSNQLPFNIVIDNLFIDNGIYHAGVHKYHFNGKLKCDYKKMLNLVVESFDFASDDKILFGTNNGTITFQENDFFLDFPEFIILGSSGSFTFRYDMHQNKFNYSKLNFNKIDLGKYGIIENVIFTIPESSIPIFNIENSFNYASNELNSIIELNINELKNGHIGAHVFSESESKAQYDIDIDLKIKNILAFDIAVNHFKSNTLLVNDFQMNCNFSTLNNGFCNINSISFDYFDLLIMNEFTGLFEIDNENYIFKNIHFVSNMGDGKVPYGKFSTRLDALNCNLNVIDMSQLTNYFNFFPKIEGDPFNIKIDYSTIKDSTITNFTLHADKLKWNTVLINGCDIESEKINDNLKYKAAFYQPLFSGIKLDSLFLSGQGGNGNYFNIIKGFNNSTGEKIESQFTYINDTTLDIEYIKGRLKDVPFNAEKLSFNKTDKMVVSSPLTIDFGRGHIYAQVKYLDEDDYILNLGASQVDFVELNKMFQFQNRINGEINGELDISFDNGIPIIRTNLNFRDGNFDDILFESIDIQASLHDHHLTLSQVDINTDIGQLKFNGSLTATGNESIFSDSDELALNGEFEKFELSYLKRYFPWEQKTTGLLSGTINVTGKASSPRIELNSLIEAPSFDRITAKSISGDLIYKKNRLYFKHINLLTMAGKYTGKGSIPVNLNFMKMVDLNIMEQPLEFIFTGKSNSFEFLVPYIDQIESLDGEFSMQLVLSGTLNNPIRGGLISIQEAKLELLQLNNNIESLSGIATITNNKLVIKKLTGRLIKGKDDGNLITNVLSVAKKIWGGSKNYHLENNIFVNGTLDLTEFFNPNYTVSIDGNDIYMSSTYGQFKGEGDAEIFITGKDTLLVSGEFRPSPNNFKLLSFGDEYRIDMVSGSEGKAIQYDIHVPFQDGILIDTDEVKMLVEGDINIITSNSGELVYSGKINIVEGIFNYNNNEFSQAEGKLILDPSKPTPYAEISAQTQLADENIEVTFIGFLDNPNLILESSSQQYSQSDILRMLTFKDSNIIDDPSASSQVGELLANYMERELERNVSRYTELDAFKVSRSGSLVSGLDESNVNIYLGKRITSNLYLNTKVYLNQSNKMNEYEMAYRLNRNMSIIARVDKNQYWHFNFRYKYPY